MSPDLTYQPPISFSPRISFQPPIGPGAGTGISAAMGPLVVPEANDKWTPHAAKSQYGVSAVASQFTYGAAPREQFSGVIDFSHVRVSDALKRALSSSNYLGNRLAFARGF